MHDYSPWSVEAIRLGKAETKIWRSVLYARIHWQSPRAGQLLGDFLIWEYQAMAGVCGARRNNVGCMKSHLCVSWLLRATPNRRIRCVSSGCGTYWSSKRSLQKWFQNQSPSFLLYMCIRVMVRTPTSLYRKEGWFPVVKGCKCA